MTDSRTLGQSVPKEGLFLMDGIEGLRSLPKWLCRLSVFMCVATSTWKRLPQTLRASATPISWHCSGVTSPSRKLW